MGHPLCLLCSLTTFLIPVSPILLSRLETQQESRSRKTILCSKVCDLVSDNLRAQRLRMHPVVSVRTKAVKRSLSLKGVTWDMGRFYALSEKT